MAEKYAANLPRTLLRHRAGSVLRFPTESSTGPRSNCGRDFNGQQDGQAGGQWHIYGTQECKKLFSSVSQRQRTTHESADRQHSERVSPVLLIRKSSVRARRGPPSICAGQKLKILLRAPPNRPGEGPNGTFWHIAFESVGHRFGPGNAKRCLRRSSLKDRGRVKALVTSDLGCVRPVSYT